MRRYTDLALVILINAILIILVILSELSNNIFLVPVRAITAYLYVVFIPGYAIQAALLPRPGHMALLDRIAISFGLSIALMSILGLILDGPPGGVFLWQSVIFLSLVTGVFSCVAIYRRSRLKEEEFTNVSTETLSFGNWWQTASDVSRAGFFVLSVLVIIAAFITVFSLSTTKSDQLFTEFSILSTDNVAVNYPHEVIIGQPFTFKVGVTNHEGMDITYSIEAHMNGRILAGTAPFTLTDGQSTSLGMNVAASTRGDQQLLEILLLRDNQIYRRLYLWLDVKAP